MLHIMVKRSNPTLLSLRKPNHRVRIRQVNSLTLPHMLAIRKIEVQEGLNYCFSVECLDSRELSVVLLVS